MLLKSYGHHHQLFQRCLQVLNEDSISWAPSTVPFSQKVLVNVSYPCYYSLHDHLHHPTRSSQQPSSWCYHPPLITKELNSGKQRARCWARKRENKGECRFCILDQPVLSPHHAASPIKHLRICCLLVFSKWYTLSPGSLTRQANMTVFFPGKALQTGSWDNWIPAIWS